MSIQIPSQTVNYFRQLNDLAVGWFGIECTLYVPTNLTALEPEDIYTATQAVTYKKYMNQLVWFEWFNRDLVKLRKNNVFTEKDTPIVARFRNDPEVLVNSYIALPTRFINNQYHTNEFTCVNPVLENTYDAEIYRKFKMYPRRAKGK